MHVTYTVDDNKIYIDSSRNNTWISITGNFARIILSVQILRGGREDGQRF